MNQSEHDNQMTQIELKSPKISQLISALQAMKMEHGDVIVDGYDNDVTRNQAGSLRLEMVGGELIIEGIG